MNNFERVRVYFSYNDIEAQRYAFCHVSFIILRKLEFFSLYIAAWPSGTYSMVAPRTGCPSGFKVGWRYQDNEDAGTQNRITTDHHFQGQIAT